MPYLTADELRTLAAALDSLAAIAETGVVPSGYLGGIALEVGDSWVAVCYRADDPTGAPVYTVDVSSNP